MEFKSKTQIIGYIAGMFDGEGTVGMYGKYNAMRRIAITGTEYELIKTVSDYLNILGIKNRIYERKYTGKYANKNWKNAFDVTIYGKENFEKFYKFIPFVSIRKREIMKKVIESYRISKCPPKEELEYKYLSEKLSYIDLMKIFKVKSTGTIGYWMKKYQIPAREGMNQYVSIP